MRGNRRRDSAPERRLRSALHARGLRYRVDLPIRVAGRRPIRPDVVFTRARVAVFVDGCFWHGCRVHSKPPRTNAPYWSQRRRDRVAQARRHGVADLSVLSDPRPLEPEAGRKRLQRGALLNGEAPQTVWRDRKRLASIGEMAVVGDDPRGRAPVELLLIDDRRCVAAHRGRQRLRRAIEIKRPARPVEEKRAAVRGGAHNRLSGGDDARAGHRVVARLTESRQARERLTHRRRPVRGCRDRGHRRAFTRDPNQEHPLPGLGNSIVRRVEHHQAGHEPESLRAAAQLGAQRLPARVGTQRLDVLHHEGSPPDSTRSRKWNTCSDRGSSARIRPITEKPWQGGPPITTSGDTAGTRTSVTSPQTA